MEQPSSKELYARARQLIRRVARDKGMTVTFERTDGKEFFDLNAHEIIGSVDGFVEKLRFAAPSTWQHWAEHYVKATEEARQSVNINTVDYPLDELFANIRVRLMNFPAETEAHFTYAPEFIEDSGIKKVLCLDGETTIKFVTDADIDDFDVSLEQLYTYGQRNTDAEPNDDVFEYTPQIHSIDGISNYVAAKAANMENLVDTIIGAAPDGVLFAIPHRHVVFYAVPTVDNLSLCFSEMAEVLSGFLEDPNLETPGGLLSRFLFYWSPDNTYSIIGGHEIGEDGELGELIVVPSPEFMERFNIQAED